MRDDFVKIKRKIEEKTEGGVIGLASLDEGVATDEISEKLADLLGKSHKSLLVDFKEDGKRVEDFLKNPTLEEGGGLTRLSLRPEEVEALDGEAFKEIFQERLRDFTYCLISEGRIEGDPALVFSKFEDKKIFLVTEDLTKKPALRRAIKDCEDLGLEILGFIYKK